MDEARFIELLVDLHAGLRRQGPGSPASTLRALQLCAELPHQPEILDVGCGAGEQSLTLAEATGGTVTAVDLFGSFLEDLEAEAGRRGLGGRVRTLQADMTDLPLDDGSFDLVWSEGAVYIMGFDAGLDAWRRLLRPGGLLAVSELSWFTEDPPADLRAHWEAEYPGIRSVEANARAAEALGYEVLGHFRLPPSDWVGGYYGPLEAQIEPFLARHGDDPAAAAVAQGTREEIALYEEHGEHYGYAFYVLRRR